MKGLAELLKLIQKLYGKRAMSKTIGTRTNVITLPDKDTKRFVTNELNIDAASDAAVKKAYEDAEKLIPDIPKMNDQEILTLTGNLRRIDNRMNPPSAEIVDITTKQPVAGIEKLAAERGFPQGVDPESTMGRLLTSTRKLQDEAKKLKQTEGGIPFQMGDIKGTASADELFDMITKNPYRSGGPLDPSSGIVRTAARQILRKKLDAGEIDIPDKAERDAIAKGYQGGVDPIEVFRKRFGEDPLQDLDEIADQLNRAGDFKEIDEILKRNKLFDIEPKKDYGYQEGSMTDEELREVLKKAEDETPDEFAKGGRVGFAYGSLPKGIQKLYRAINKKFGKGTIKTAYELENPKRPLTDEEIKMYEEELGDSETWMSEGTLEEAENALKRQEEYEAAMYRDYRAGKLDPEPGDKSEARMKLLRDRAEEMEATGDRRLMSEEDMDELSELEAKYLKDVDEAYGLDTKLRKELNEMKNLGANKMAERFELKQKYPGIDDDLLTQIIDDPDPQRKAEALSVIDQAFELMKRGKSPDEILEIMKKGTDRTKQAGGGLAYLMGL